MSEAGRVVEKMGGLLELCVIYLCEGSATLLIEGEGGGIGTLANVA